MVEVLRESPRLVSEFYLTNYEQKLRDTLSQRIFRQVTATNNFTILPNKSISELEKERNKLVDRIRSTHLKNFFRVKTAKFDRILFETQPIIFEDVSVGENDVEFVEMAR
jgi:hypothetical protein